MPAADERGMGVYAVEAGVVVASLEAAGSWGNIVMLRHDGPDGSMWSQYAHLQRRDVLLGAVVAKGQQIATVGDAGGQFAPHLHFELRKVEIPATAWPGAGGAPLALQHARARTQYVNPIGLLGAE